MCQTGWSSQLIYFSYYRALSRVYLIKFRFDPIHSYFVLCHVIFFFINKFNTIKILNYLKFAQINVTCRL